MPDLPASASAANMVHFATDGTIRRSTSSRRYKQNIKAADVDVEAALKLTPRTFREKAEVAARLDDLERRLSALET